MDRQILPERRIEGNIATRSRQVLAAAEQLVEGDVDWATFFRKILGEQGVARRAFPNPQSLELFKKTAAYRHIQEILVKLRFDSEVKSKRHQRRRQKVSEPTHMITVRLPASVHQALLAEADDMRTSMNQLCISKLLQLIESDLVPGATSQSRSSPEEKEAMDWVDSFLI